MSYTAIISALLLTAVGLIIGMSVLTYLVCHRTKADRAVREPDAWTLERLREQLRDFYGPLYILTQATQNARDVTLGTDVWETAWREVILPAYLQIETILVSRMDLIDDDEMSPLLFDFLKHSMINRSYQETGLRVGYLEMDVTYPIEFGKAIANGFLRKRSEYLRILGDRN